MKKPLLPLLKTLFPLLMDPAFLVISSGLAGLEAGWLSTLRYSPFGYGVFASLFLLLFLTHLLSARVYAIEHNSTRKFAFTIMVGGIFMNLLCMIIFMLVSAYS